MLYDKSMDSLLIGNSRNMVTRTRETKAMLTSIIRKARVMMRSRSLVKKNKQIDLIWVQSILRGGLRSKSKNCFREYWETSVQRRTQVLCRKSERKKKSTLLETKSILIILKNLK